VPDPSPARDGHAHARRRARETQETLRRLEESGALRGLPGEGAPLPPDPDAEAGDAWAARHLMRGANAVPVWVELRREIDDRTARLRRRLRAHGEWLSDREALLRRLPADRIVDARRATLLRDERVRREIGAAVDELNALIRRYDLQVHPALQLPLVDLDSLWCR
jgi:hypothetical protein